jgi:hypothetical protein
MFVLLLILWKNNKIASYIKLITLNKLFLFTIFTILISCKREIESPYELAKKYCACLDEKFKTTPKDSLIDIGECERQLYPESRFMRIWMAENKQDYSQMTLDSASVFAIKVRDIEDSLCYNERKIDFKRVKRFPCVANQFLSY